MKNKLLEACVKCGLNLKTGISPFIKLKKLQKKYNKPITGNGSILRRDTVPFKYFQVDIIKAHNKVIGYKFNGYVTAEYEHRRLADQLINTKQRVKNEIKKIKKRMKELDNLPKGKKTILYNYKNIK